MGASGADRRIIEVSNHRSLALKDRKNTALLEYRPSIGARFQINPTLQITP
jgi:hypothetical protein